MVNAELLQSEKSGVDVDEVIRSLRTELQIRDEKIMLMNDEMQKERENWNKKTNIDLTGSGFTGNSMKIEVPKKKVEDTEVSKLKSTMKKMEEKIELLSIEKDQLERNMSEKNQELEIMKDKLTSSTKSMQETRDEYAVSLQKLKEMNQKITSLYNILPTADDFSQMKTKIEEYEKMKKDIKNSTTSNNNKQSTKSANKSVSKDSSLNKQSNNTTILESIRTTLSNNLEDLEKFNTNYIKDITNEYFHLELELEEYKIAKENQIKMMGMII